MTESHKRVEKTFFLCKIIFRAKRGILVIYEFSDRISNKLLDKKIIKEDDIQIYTYGFEIVISSFLILLAVIGIGIIFNCLVKAIIFMIFFCSLRIQAGGYHADTHLKCFSYFVLSCFIGILMAQLLSNYDKVHIVRNLVLIESCIIVIAYAPVDTINKPLNSLEKISYKKRSVITVFIQAIIILAICTINDYLKPYCLVASIAVFIQTVTLLPVINKPMKKEGLEYVSKY
jgi:accessory gene regulator B